MTEEDEEGIEEIRNFLDKMKAPDTFTFYRENGQAVLSVVSFDGTSVEQMVKDLHETAEQLKRFGYDPKSNGRIVPRAH